MPRIKIEGVSQGDAGKYCLLTHLELGPNPRDHLDEDAYQQLLAQVRDHGGVHTPLKCRTKADRSGLVVYDGQRRLRAATELGLEKVPVAIERGNEKDLLLLAGTAEGEAHDMVAQIRWVQLCTAAGATQAEIATKRGVSRGWVSQRLTMTALSEAARTALREGLITQAKAMQLAKLDEPIQNSEVRIIREAKEAGNGKAGTVKPKRPGLKTAKQVLDAIEIAPPNPDYTASLDIVRGAVADGIRWATGKLSSEDLLERYGVEL